MLAAALERRDYLRLLKERLAPYSSEVAEIAASLDQNSDIVYSPIEPILARR
jgi:hypothetical protein